MFASEMVTCVGQVLGLVVARDQATAQRAARLVKVTYRDLGDPIITIQVRGGPLQAGALSVRPKGVPWFQGHGSAHLLLYCMTLVHMCMYYSNEYVGFRKEIPLQMSGANFAAACLVYKCECMFRKIKWIDGPSGWKLTSL